MGKERLIGRASVLEVLILYPDGQRLVVECANLVG